MIKTAFDLAGTFDNLNFWYAMDLGCFCRHFDMAQVERNMSMKADLTLFIVP
jgi:hypothetical protein